MSTVGELEARTQKRVVEFFLNSLGYRYLGFWQDRDDNSNVEEEELTKWLRRRSYDDRIIGKVLRELNKARALGGSKTLYDANREVYGLLRYGVKVIRSVLGDDDGLVDAIYKIAESQRDY